MAFGRLERTTGAPPMSDINMTPLIDVMLVLLVIFIITAPLLASSIKLDLPKADVAASGDTPRFVLLVVDKTGQVFLDDKPVAPAELARRLVLVAGKNPDTEVQLRADEAVPYGRVVEVLGFVAEPKPAAP
jgi:biopolymer transport protein TolR